MAYTTPPTVSVGNKLTASNWNTYVGDNFDSVADALTSYTPTYTNFSLGNGTVSAAYSQVNKRVIYRGKITLGTTSSVTSTIRISLPVTSLLTAFGAPLGTVHLFDTSASARRNWFANLNSSTDFYMSNDVDTRANAANPWAWATGDTIEWAIWYEAA